MNSHPRDVLLTLLTVNIATKMTLFDNYWFKCDGPVDKDAINRGLRLYFKDKEKIHNQIVDRNATVIYNVFVAENKD
jgi:hypothetical protein